ncbi:RNA polymerase II mediator complex subunit [Paraconiothyrium brasiliense]|uniref:Mediator of RNA polymerase II transcription subunit 21 n=1 Tax=Paraconiothyrium brasiliense TaxID=300254 RepID=A0ABR3RU54_9PLEO
MGDILTQIQDELDMLLNQMQSSFAYIRNRAPPAPIPGQPMLSSMQEFEAQNIAAANPSAAPPAPPPLPTAEEFQKDIAELSRDMVLKEQQIEVLIASLPGLDKSEAEQVARMKELEKELEGLEGERMRAVEEKEALVKKVEGKIVKAGKMGS